ncbi:YvrJ family protein [Halobacillus yeomjeoni]|uniref:YvrJ family protein n=1 Tax=Halobacillus yeomjeoni TaxID=311194 RepID=A0A931HS84_9BACI|nr:YvrJ family protein [Halobacillus yeomjeoni]MBH0228947.1 YvrJ family protein [Halobacillus yeomjeoni]MCA0983674.1 YvrJ family protein [Halobacillus yeomjeoni]
MEHWVPVLTEVGFPIAVTFYLLHRIETKLNLLIETLHQLPDKLTILK